MTHRLLAALIFLALTATGCAYPAAGADPAGSTRPPRAAPIPKSVTAQPATGTAKLILAELRQVRVIATRPDVPGYTRNQFGQTWTDNHTGRSGHNGCDTRNDVLTAQLISVQYRGRSRCVVITGTQRGCGSSM